MRARTFWRRFTKTIHGIVPGQAMPFGPEVVDGRNMNKARRIIKREEQRSLRRLAKPSQVRRNFEKSYAAMVAHFDKADKVYGREKRIQELEGEFLTPHVERYVTQVGSIPGGVISAEQFTNLVDYNEAAFQESLSVSLGPATRDQIRKAFTQAGLTGFRNARKEQMILAFEGATHEQKQAVVKSICQQRGQ